MIRKRDMYINYERSYKRRRRRKGSFTLQIALIIIIALCIGGMTLYFVENPFINRPGGKSEAEDILPEIPEQDPIVDHADEQMNDQSTISDSK
ncbi:MAG: hypothetical protein K0S76_773 [Herbinix sp.]|nr:hypothetical protein [Herbinix sp.]